MRLVVLAAAERSAFSSMDAAVLDGAALAAVLHSAGHDVELATLPAPDASLLGRSMAVIETGAILVKLALQRPTPDAVVMVAPPHSAALAADLVAALRRIPGAVLLTSLSTEAQLQTGEISSSSMWGKIRNAVETALVRRARLLVVPTEGLRRRVLLRGAPTDHVQLVRELFAPILPAPDDANVARLRGRLAEGADCLVVMPAALGAATDLGALTGALTRLQHDHGFAFAAVGGGSRASTVAEMIQARGIRNAKVVQLTRADRRAAVHAADILLGVSVPAHDGLCVPRSLTRSLWAGRPLVVVGPDGSELVREVRRLGLGPTLAPGDEEGLTAALRSLAADPRARADLAARAHAAGAQQRSPVQALIEALHPAPGRPGVGALAGA